MTPSPLHDDTLCVSHPEVSHDGFAGLAVPTYRASTIVFDDARGYAERRDRGPDGYVYGLHGTPTSRTLEAQLTALHHGERTAILPSGQAAIAIVMLAFLKPGDRVLIPDTAYPPVRALCVNHLEPRGIAVGIYDPLVGAGIGDLMDARTRLVWVESPGSTTMEVQDIPAIAAAARAHGALVGCDNSWATPLLFKPLDHGVDFAVEALTKYVGGHSDLLLGSVTVKDRAHFAHLKETIGALGFCVSPDECSLAIRGLETMAVRLRHVGDVALRFAARLDAALHDARVLHPGLPHAEGHALWKRDYLGASGVFSVALVEAHEERLDAALGALEVFSIGNSWGGTHSLVAPMMVGPERRFGDHRRRRTVLRISIGLENEGDLWSDLERMFAVLAGPA